MKEPADYPHARPLFEWLFVFFSAIQVGGVFVDGWAHVHVLSEIESFFTPWHALFYGGFLLSTALLLAELLKNHARGYPWLRALPREYRFALAGVLIFMIGGFGDFIWHTLFGIEAGVDALMSPTHLLLAMGGAMMASGPLHAIWYRDTNVHTIVKGPVVVSFILFFMVFTFMVQFFHPYFLPLWMSHLPVGEYVSEFKRELGIANAVVYTGVFMGLVLSTVRYWKFPFGSFTFILGVNVLGMSLMQGEWYLFSITGFAAGFFIDLFYQRIFHGLRNSHVLRIFGFLVPVIIFEAYVLTVLAAGTTWWSVHFVIGYIAIAGIVGTLMTYMVVSPGDRA